MIAIKKPVTPLMTVGQIAQLLRQPVHRIAYIINTRRIDEAARAGRLRVFDLEAVGQIRSELAAIDGNQEQSG